MASLKSRWKVIFIWMKIIRRQPPEKSKSALLQIKFECAIWLLRLIELLWLLPEIEKRGDGSVVSCRVWSERRKLCFMPLHIRHVPLSLPQKIVAEMKNFGREHRRVTRALAAVKDFLWCSEQISLWTYVSQDIIHFCMLKMQNWTDYDRHAKMQNVYFPLSLRNVANSEICFYFFLPQYLVTFVYYQKVFLGDLLSSWLWHQGPLLLRRAAKLLLILAVMTLNCPLG